MDGWLTQDIHFTLRSLRKNPGFAAVAVLSLALGIGANVAVFSFVNAVLLRPLPVPAPDRLAAVYQRSETRAAYLSSASYPDYEYYRAHNQAFSDMLAYLRVPVMLRSGETPRRISSELVSPNYFQVLELRPALGRWFAPGETDSVVVLSYALWRLRFGGDVRALGSSLRIGQGAYTVIGVAPPDFRGIVLDWQEPPDVWLPVTAWRAAVPALASFDIVHAWGMQSYLVVGRLRGGATLAQAQAQIETLAARLSDSRPGRERMGRWTAVVYPIQQARFWPAYRGAVVSFLALLSTVAGLVLLIACFNLANLLLARAASRQGELALRLALGAGGGRVARQLVTESLTLAALGGMAGAAVAVWTTGFLSGFRHAFRIPLALDTGWDGRVLAFAAGITLLAGVVFGLAPALRLARADLHTLLKSGLGGSRNTRLRSAFVIAQVALSIVLLSGAGLFVRTLRNARAPDITQPSENVLLAPVDVAAAGYPEERGARLYADLLERARHIGGVRAAGLATIVPLGGFRGGTDVMVTDAASAADRRPVQVDFNPVSDGYFETAGLPVLRGRGFTAADCAGAPRAAVVNEEWVRRFWPGQEPLGRQIQLTRPAGTAVVVVGVVRDGRYRSYRDSVRPCLYVPLAQHYMPAATLEVRAEGQPFAVLAALRREMLAVDRNLAAGDITTLEAHVDESLSPERLSATLLSGFALLALALSAIGIYGVMAYAAAQRRREIGVRIALGARPADIGRLVAFQGLRLAAAGVAAGTALALALARLIASQLYGVSAADPATYILTAALLLAAAVAASWLPARRAARIDPVAALRQE